MEWVFKILNQTLSKSQGSLRHSSICIELLKILFQIKVSYLFYYLSCIHWVLTVCQVYLHKIQSGMSSFLEFRKHNSLSVIVQNDLICLLGVYSALIIKHMRGKYNMFVILCIPVRQLSFLLFKLLKKWNAQWSH